MPSRLAGAVNHAAIAIVTTRDFCGDERQAAVEALKEMGSTPSPKVLQMAQRKAERIWSLSQYEAGVVHPLMGAARAKALSALR